MRHVIRKLLGERVKIIDGSIGTAKELKRRLEANELINDSTEKGTVVFENSKNTEEEIDLCRRLFETEIE